MFKTRNLPSTVLEFHIFGLPLRISAEFSLPKHQCFIGLQSPMLRLQFVLEVL